MTRRPSLTSLFYGSVSDEAMEAVVEPKLFAVRIAQSYLQQGEALDMLGARRGFLAWVQMWLHLLLGMEPETAPTANSPAPYPAALLHYRVADYVTHRRAPAHNLTALMRFAPDAAGRGLTLNQYRERFTRLSVIGWMKIYAQFFRRRLGSARRVRCGQTHAAALRGSRDSLCHAPIHPD